MIKFIQINLHRSGTAQNLLAQTAVERGAQVMIVSEQNWNPRDDRWISSLDGTCAVSTTRAAEFVKDSSGSGRGFAWIQCRNTTVYSCYVTRNCDMVRYNAFLDDLESSIRQQPGSRNIIVGGDFNAWSNEWGSEVSDLRGRLLADLAASLNLSLCNTGSNPTYERANARSIIDLTFTRLDRQHELISWEVLSDIYSGSDHHYIEYRICTTPGSTRTQHPGHSEVLRNGWSLRQLDREALLVHLRDTNPIPVTEETSAEQASDNLTAYLTQVCNSCMPRRKKAPAGKRPTHWWSGEIASLRKEVLQSKRRYQRAYRRNDDQTAQDLQGEYKVKRKELSKKIRKAQEKSWAELCEAVEADPWGIPYRVVTKKIGMKRPGIEAIGREEAIADHLFPGHPPTDWTRAPRPDVNDVSNENDSTQDLGNENGQSIFTIDELMQACDRLPSGKAAGPDGVPNEVLSQVARAKPRVFLDTFNTCLRESKFPPRWKKSRLVLLHKGPGKPNDSPSSYRPLNMLDSTAKLLERLILKRLNEHLDNTGQRSENQFGFREGRSTEDAMAAILRVAKGAAHGAVQHRDLCVMISLDVRNAFNTAPWIKIDAALRKKRTPPYLIRFIRSYLEDRYLLVGEEQNPRKVTCGVPQGSVIGPALWNLFYDDLLQIPLPTGVQMFAFADDVALIGTARTGEQLEPIMNIALASTAAWMTENGLSLAPQKTEALILSRKRVYTTPALRLENQNISITNTIRYLGLELDTKLSFTAHVSKASRKAMETAKALSRIMPNIGGPSQSKRTLLSTVVLSKVLYAAPVWAEVATKTAKNRETMTRSLRPSLLRIIRAYRTVSTEGALVLAGIPPVDLLASERKRIRQRLEENEENTSLSNIKRQERGITINAWQNRWSRSTKAQWTRNLIPDLARWLNSKVTMNFHLTQALSGHGCFREYLFRRNRAVNNLCTYCDEIDTAEHTIFICGHWNEQREPLKPHLGGRTPTPDDVMDLLCGPTNMPEGRAHLKDAKDRARKAFIKMVNDILSTKEEDERRVQLRNH